MKFLILAAALLILSLLFIFLYIQPAILHRASYPKQSVSSPTLAPAAAKPSPKVISGRLADIDKEEISISIPPVSTYQLMENIQVPSLKPDQKVTLTLDEQDNVIKIEAEKRKP